MCIVRMRKKEKYHARYGYCGKNGIPCPQNTVTAMTDEYYRIKDRCREGFLPYLEKALSILAVSDNHSEPILL